MLAKALADTSFNESSEYLAKSFAEFRKIAQNP
jgi:hypothetical protein